MSLGTFAAMKRHSAEGASAPPPSGVQHWYKVAEEDQTVTVTGNVRFGVARGWTAPQAVSGLVTASAANFGVPHDATRLQQLQCDSEAYSSKYFKIMPLGDSITANDSPGSGWRLLLQQLNTWLAANKRPIDFIGNGAIVYNNITPDMDHNGYSGYRVSDVNNPAGSGMHPGYPNTPDYFGDARDVDDWFAGTAADMVIMHFGTNDLAGVDATVSTTTVLAGYSTLLARARLQNPNVIFIVAQIIGIGTAYPGGDARVQDLNAHIPGWASANSTGQSQIIVVDQYTGFDPATMTNEGIHPNAAGATQMADRFFQAIEPYLLAVSNKIVGYGTQLMSNQQTYYGQMWPFRNISVTGGAWHDLFGSSGVHWWDQIGTVFDAVTWHMTALPTGQYQTRDIAFAQAEQEGFMPPGDYMATTQLGCFCTLDTSSMGGGGGLTNVVNGTDAAHPTLYFTIPPGANAAANDSSRTIGVSLSVAIHNATGSTKSAADFYCGLVSSYSAWQAGDWWDPTFLADLAGVDHMRFQGVNGENYGGDKTFSLAAINTPNSMLWASDSQMQYQYPPEVCADLCYRLGCKLWLNLRSGNQKLLWGFSFATNTFTVYDFVNVAPFAHGFTEDEPVSLGGWLFTGGTGRDQQSGWPNRTQYYVHLVAGQPTQLQLKVAAGGALAVEGIADAVVDYGRTIGTTYTPATVQAYYTAIFSRIKTYWDGKGYAGSILPEVGNEPWNMGYELNYWAAQGSVMAGVPWNAGGGYAWHQLNAAKAAIAVFGANRVIVTVTGQGVYFDGFGANALEYVDAQGILDSTQSKTVAQILAEIGGYYTMDAYFFPSLSTQDSSFPSSLAAGSSWGAGDNIENNGFYKVGDRTYDGGHDYQCSAQHTPDSTNRPPNATYWTDLGPGPFPVGSAATWTNSQWEACWKRGIDRLVSFAVYTRSRLATVAPGVKVIAYESGFGLAQGANSNWEVTQAGYDAFMGAYNFMNAPLAADVIDYYVDTYLKPFPFAAICQYSSGGGHQNYPRSGTVGQQSYTAGWLAAWGIKKAPQFPDTVWCTRMRLRCAELS